MSSGQPSSRGPTVAAISIERTTSANTTVTCLYSAGVDATVVGEPHSSQNFAVGRNSEPQLVQFNTAVTGPNNKAEQLSKSDI